MIGCRVLIFIAWTLDPQEQAICFMGFATNLGLHVEFVNAFFISPKTIAVLPSSACRYLLHWYLCPLWGTQLGAEGRSLCRTIVIL